MGESLKVNGEETIWKEWESTHGMMVGGMKETIKMTRNMGLVFINGPMAGSTWDIGAKASNMALASI
jgi:hypothetical protein